MPTLEALWRTYGRRLTRLAHERLASEPVAAEAVCYEVMVRAGTELLAVSVPPSADADFWPWLERLAEAVFGEIETKGVDPSWVPAGPLPDSLPTRLRTLLRLRAEREAAELALERHGPTGPIGEALLRMRRRLREEFDKRHGLPAWVPAYAGLRRALEGTGREARTWSRKLDAVLAPAAQSASRLGGLVASTSVAGEAMAVIGVAIAVGISGPASAPTQPLFGGTVLASSTPIAAWGGASTGTGGAAALDRSPSSSGDTRADARTTERVSVPSTPDATAPPDLAEAPHPEVTADPGRAVAQPVREQHHEDRDSYETSDAPIGADVDGDGDDEVSDGAPQLSVVCPEPEERGVVTGVACPALDAGVPNL